SFVFFAERGKVRSIERRCQPAPENALFDHGKTLTTASAAVHHAHDIARLGRAADPAEARADARAIHRARAAGAAHLAAARGNSAAGDLAARRLRAIDAL